MRSWITKNPVSNSAEKLHFIISPGRSGTTLLRKHLLENTTIHIPPESYSLIHEVSRNYLNQKADQKTVDKSIDSFLALGLNKYWKIQTSKLREYIHDNFHEDSSLQALILSFYTYHSICYNPEANAFVDKTPFLSQNLKWLQIIYPESNYLFLIRNPFDVTFSRMRYFHESIEEASDRWLWSVKEYMKYKHCLNWKLVFYESLVKNFDEKMAEIALFFHADLIGKKKKIALGEEHFDHHANLFKDIRKMNSSSWNSKELDFLSRKFSNITDAEIRAYYSV
ncbi:MAG: sulfotransferase [Bacteroidota bacterium]